LPIAFAAEAFCQADKVGPNVTLSMVPEKLGEAVMRPPTKVEFDNSVQALSKPQLDWSAYCSTVDLQYNLEWKT